MILQIRELGALEYGAPAAIGIVPGSLHFDKEGRGLSACSLVISLDFMRAFDRIHVFRMGRVQVFPGGLK